MSIQIAVSTMTNCDSFLEEGVSTAMAKLHGLSVSAVEMSRHIQFNEETIPQFLEAKERYGIRVCAISAQFEGTKPSPMPPMIHKGISLKTYSSERDFDQLVDLCHQFDCKYVRFAGFPGYALLTLAEVKAYMAALEEISARFAGEGIGFCVHNHADEFMKVDGKCLIEWAMELCPHLLYELDVLNAQKCGANPIDILKTLKGKVPLLHVQDLQVVPTDNWLSPEYRGVPVGTGNLNYKAIVQAAVETQAEYLIIEQARFYGEDPYRCIEVAQKNLEIYCGS